jgi:uncharacterized protein (DUF885 family)
MTTSPEHDSNASRAVRYLPPTVLRAAALQALRYFTEALGSPEISNIGEVNRYCVEPAQACGYMIGKLAWVSLRERARNELGTRFDIRDFHHTALLSGSMPLAVLEVVMQAYIRARRG